MAWAREVFQELFYERVSQLSHLSQSIRNDGHEGSRLWLETASTEDRFWIALLLADLPISALRKEVRSTAADDDAVAAALRWAERLFRHLFVQEVEALLQAHPPTSRDEDAPDGETAFWSG